MFIAGEQQELEQLRAERLQRDLEDSGCDLTLGNLIKHESYHQPTDVKTEFKPHNFKLVDSQTTFKQEIKSELDTNTEYDEWLCIQKELGYVNNPAKTEIKLEDSLDPKKEDIEELRNDNKRALPTTSDCSQPLKRVCHSHSQDLESTNKKLSESEVFRTCSVKKGGSNSKNECIDLDLELVGGLDLNLLKTNHLDSFDENIDAQVQSAIDSILNLQQNQDGSINMNALIATSQQSVVSAQQAGVVDDKNAQFFNDLLGVQTNHSRKLSMDTLKRKIDKVNDSHMHFQNEDLVQGNDIIFRDGLAKQLNHQQRLVNHEINHLGAAGGSENNVDSFSECSSPDDALDQAVRSILS